jgi:hypothetical protein
MDIFNWGAPKDSPVVSPRFWLYWVVTVPLTLVVLMIWSIWLQKHHKHETQRKTPGRGLPSDSTTDTLEETLTGKTGPWYMNTLIKITHTIMDMSPVREAESGHSTVEQVHPWKQEVGLSRSKYKRLIRCSQSTKMRGRMRERQGGFEYLDKKQECCEKKVARLVQTFKLFW